MLSSLINLVFIITLTQNTEPQVNYLKNMTVSYGTFKDKITVEWEKVDCKSYTVLRSKFKTGPFEQVAQTTETVFNDTTAEKGIKYWYKIISESPLITEEDESAYITEDDYLKIPERIIQNEIKKNANVNSTINSQDEKNENLPDEKINSYSGYIPVEKPIYAKLPELIKQKKEKLKLSHNKEENSIQVKHLQYLKPYYMNPVKFNLLITLSKPYLDRKELVILTDSISAEAKHFERKTIFYGNSYSFVVEFESKKFLSLLEKSGDFNLIARLIKNAEIFCIYKGQAEIQDQRGITRIIHCYDAIGVSTRYLKNDADWKSKTIMISTSRADLKEKLKKISAATDQD